MSHKDIAEANIFISPDYVMIPHENSRQIFNSSLCYEKNT